MSMLLNVLIGVVLLFGGTLDAAALELRTAAQRSAPKYYQAEPGEPVRGLCIDILQALDAITPGLSIGGYQDFLPSARIYADLRSGDLDLFCGSGKTDTREQQVRYLEPALYPVQHRLAVRRDDPVRVSSFAELRALGTEGVVLTYLNSATHHFLLQQPGLQIDGGSNLSNLFERLLLGRGRFIYYHDLGLNHYIRSHRLESRVRLLPAVFQRYHHYLVVSKRLPEPVVAELQRALADLAASGALQRLYQRYAPSESGS